MLGTLATHPARAQDIPLVYDVENTGADCSPPPLPAFVNLPFIEPLTDPFESSDGSVRDTTFAAWRCRRAEIKSEIEHYEIGEKPIRPDTLTATFADGTLTVNVTVNGKTLTLTSAINLPAGDGPFPAVIGMGGGSGSLPSDIFTSRGIALIPFNFGQVMAHTQTRGSEPINQLYPELTYMGAYSAWSWGVSRLIDGLELVSNDLPIDLHHLGATGCSFAGKMALFAGAFDERIALTIAQESGGGGAAAWRVSQTLGAVETLGATSRAWFINDMFQFAGTAVSKLPMDHHELVAMVAPRALLVLGNPDYVWLADESGYVSSRAAHKVWQSFGISDRFGFSIVGGHNHCALPGSQRPEVEAFVDKFMLGDSTATTAVTKHPYEDVNAERWYQWWGAGDPVLPEPDSSNTTSAVFEAECATVGADWEKLPDSRASNRNYVSVRPGLQSLNAPPAGSDGHIVIPFSVDSTSTYAVFARLNNATADDDSYWVRMDNGDFAMFNGLTTSGWEWVRFTNYDLDAGDHTLTIGYREDGAKLDKIVISNFLVSPEGLGGPSAFTCDPTGTEVPQDTSGDIDLGQNYPNPFTPSTTITYDARGTAGVQIVVFNSLGQEIVTLVDAAPAAGPQSVVWDGRDRFGNEVGAGTYFYEIRADGRTESRKMIRVR